MYILDFNFKNDLSNPINYSIRGGLTLSLEAGVITEGPLPPGKIFVNTYLKAYFYALLRA